MESFDDVRTAASGVQSLLQDGHEEREYSDAGAPGGSATRAFELPRWLSVARMPATLNVDEPSGRWRATALPPLHTGKSHRLRSRPG